MFRQSRVSSATAFFAQSSSTRALPAVAAAMSAAIAALLSARGKANPALVRSFSLETAKDAWLTSDSGAMQSLPAQMLADGAVR
jgi:hypothetical protein